MRALGTLRRKPSLETEVKEVVVAQPSTVEPVTLIPSKNQEEVSSGFDTSVELT
jgi:hypothetical protein